MKSCLFLEMENLCGLFSGLKQIDQWIFKSFWFTRSLVDLKDNSEFNENISSAKCLRCSYVITNSAHNTWSSIISLSSMLPLQQRRLDPRFIGMYKKYQSKLTSFQPLRQEQHLMWFESRKGKFEEPEKNGVLALFICCRETLICKYIFPIQHLLGVSIITIRSHYHFQKLITVEIAFQSTTNNSLLVQTLGKL